MKAVGLTRYLPITDPESLRDVDLPSPEPHGKDLLMRIEAISVNPVDTKIRPSKGLDHHEALPQVLGWDAAGVVEATGNEVRMFQEGNAMSYSGSIGRSGCNSEYHLVDERIAAQKPISWSMAQSAAVPSRRSPPMKPCSSGWLLPKTDDRKATSS